jgi:hypothetical protein
MDPVNGSAVALLGGHERGEQSPRERRIGDGGKTHVAVTGATTPRTSTAPTATVAPLIGTLPVVGRAGRAYR